MDKPLKSVVHVRNIATLQLVPTTVW